MSAVYDHEFTVTLPPSHYRAWHKSAKKMFHSRTNDMGFSTGLGDHHIHNLVSFDFGELTPTVTVDYEEDGTPIVENQLTYMRNTFLRDKNDVEIFEGDIIDRGTKTPWHVGHKPYGFYTDVSELERYLERGDPYEVIGNVYEHPELLK